MTETTGTQLQQPLLPVVYKPQQDQLTPRVSRDLGSRVSEDSDRFEKSLIQEDDQRYSSPQARDRQFFEREFQSQFDQQRFQQSVLFDSARTVPTNVAHYATVAYETQSKPVQTTTNPGGTFDVEA